MQRFDFKREFALDLITKGSTLLFGVGVAVATGSYWGLAIGAVAGPTAAAITSYVFAPMRPRFSLSEWKHFQDMAVGPVEEGVIIRCQVIGQERAAEKGVAALQPSAVDDREDIRQAEARQVAFCREEGAFAVRMGDADGERRFLRMYRPLVGTVAEGFAQPAAKLITADIGGDLEFDAKRLPGERAVAGCSADPQFVMVDDDFRPGLRPGGGRSKDQVDVDVADDCKWPHSFAPGDFGGSNRRSGILHASIGKGDHQSLGNRQHAVCLFVGYGIGAGLILNGELYRGANGNAGEIGMSPPLVLVILMQRWFVRGLISKIGRAHV